MVLQHQKSIENYSESWESLDSKQFQKILFRLQRRIWKAVRNDDKAKARNLQKLILNSYAARMLAIRQVTQLNQGKKTAGIDGKKSLTNKERFQLEEELRIESKDCKHKGLREIPIPKKDGTTRMLKVPTIADRAWQCLVKYALEPAHEATFHERSYGFRPGRSTHDAQKHLYNNLNSRVKGINKKAFKKKVKDIVNNSSYGAETKVTKLAPVIRGWRNYHKYCKMEGSRFSLWGLNQRIRKVFLKQKTINRNQATKMVKTAFPNIGYSENKFINVKGDKSPFDGDLIYWSKRNSVLYDGHTAKALKKQNHSCGRCNLKFIENERVELHHIDGNHNNSNNKNLLAVHRSCHHFIHKEQKL
jgi:retron-type reverse transcriptase